MALIDNLVSYYKLDDNLPTTDVIDIHGPNEGTASANTSTLSVAGKINTALDGAGADYIDISAFDPTGSSGELLSVSLWTNASPQVAPEIPVIGQYDFTANKRAWRITDFDGSGTIRVYLTSDGVATGIKDYRTNNVILDGTYKQIGFTWNNGTLTVYVNGSAVAVTKVRDDVFTAITNLTSDVNLGRYAGSVAYIWDGAIDEVAIFNADIGSDGMGELWNDGDGLAYPFVVGTNMKINIGDVFKDIESLKINIGNAWKNVIKVQQNIGNVWKDVFG